MDQYLVEVNSSLYENIVAGKISEILLVNNSKVKNYRVDNQITIKNQDDETLNFMAKITNILYFDNVMDALTMLDNKKLGYTANKPLTQIEDKLLEYLKPQEVEKHGVAVIEIEKI